jgi:hypothetical protein
MVINRKRSQNLKAGTPAASLWVGRKGQKPYKYNGLKGRKAQKHYKYNGLEGPKLRILINTMVWEVEGSETV